MRYSPVGTLFAVASWDRIINIWRVPTGAKLTVLGGPGGGILALGFSPDGKTLLAGTDTGLHARWDVATWTHEGAMKAHEASIRAIAFSPDGNLFAKASHDRTVNTWDAVAAESNSQPQRRIDRSGSPSRRKRDSSDDVR